MKGWSRLKKAAAISAVAVFGLAGIGAITGSEQNESNVDVTPSPTPTPSTVQGIETEPEIQVEPTPEPSQPPPPVVTPPPIAPLAPQPEPADSCVPGYSPCIAPGPDVDCAGGSGNGPRYVSGPVYVTGSDPYDLDRDGNGVGCES